MRAPRHPSRDAIVKRLKRAEGHLHATLKMIEAKRSSLELAQQLRAVEAAIGIAKHQLIHDQMQHCLAAGEARGNVLGEMKQLAKYL